jgi:hypothetical protein
VRPNTRFHPTPLCGDKIVAILKVGVSRSSSRSKLTARVKRKPLGGF